MLCSAYRIYIWGPSITNATLMYTICGFHHPPQIITLPISDAQSLALSNPFE
jgi:hypothetical protein